MFKYYSRRCAKFFGVLLLVITVFAARGQTQQKATYDVLNPSAFKDKMEKTPDRVLIDLRTPQEVREGIIPEAETINFNAADFKQKIDKLDRDKPYFLYCKAGGRSGKTLELMKKAGFRQVHNLKGGYDEWVRQGYPTVKP